MSEPSFPPPLIDPSNNLHPLKRLRVYDGLMMNADRWQKEHQYHRQRQNIHFQSLNQPGIVYGLGVKKIEAPKEVSAQFRLQPWLKIQPGIAIDWEGNPIIVPNAINFPLNLPKTATEETLIIYLVVSYRDPEKLSSKTTGDTLQETFRIDQKTNVPAKEEVELCRVKWQPGSSEITIPQDVLFPQLNELDLRYRNQAKSRPQAIVSIGAVNSISKRTQENLSSLMNSVATLFSFFKGNTEVGLTLLKNEEAIKNYDLFYLSSDDIKILDEKDAISLNKYLETGGVIFIEVSSISEKIDDIAEIVTQKLNVNFSSWQKSINRDHPLRNQPFLFAALPEIKQYPIELWHNGGGIILTEGGLSSAWGFDEELFLSRNDIRTSQEFGINLLHFAWSRRQLQQLLK
jgi:hypothetical protein